MFPVRAHVDRSPQVIQGLLPAASERLEDARAATAMGSPTGAVYLAGYSVEMVLKHAVFRRHGLRPHQEVTPALPPVRARLVRAVGPVDHESYHSLYFWALALRETWRRRTGAVPKRAQRAAGRAMRLHPAWSISLRYRAGLVQSADAAGFLREASWFYHHARELWR